jgi:putative hydrolase of the HAD superfamily
MLRHAEGREFPFVKEEITSFAGRFGGDKTHMSADEEADFLLLCTEFELDPEMESLLEECRQKNIPMYVLSNSSFSGAALMEVLNRFGIGKYFSKLWSSADFGRIKPCSDFFELAISYALTENPQEARKDISFIGDIYETDVEGAYNAGIKSVWLNKNGGTDEKGLATYICSSAGQLAGILPG